MPPLLDRLLVFSRRIHGSHHGHRASSTSALFTFKGVSDLASHSVTVIPTSPNPAVSGVGGLVLQLENNKATLNVFSWQRDHPLQRIILPQKLACIAASPNGELVAGGSFDGASSSGKSQPRPPRFLRCALPLGDGAQVDTGWCGAGDGLRRLEDPRLELGGLARSTRSDQLGHHQLRTQSHTLLHARRPQPRHHRPAHRQRPLPQPHTILSSSADSTVKMWDLRTRSLLSTFIFEQPIHRVVLDCTERFFFAATSPGSGENAVYRIDLFRKRDASSRMV